MIVYDIIGRWVPESPRWLMQHGRPDDAKAIIWDIADHNNRPRPDDLMLKVLTMAASIHTLS